MTASKRRATRGFLLVAGVLLLLAVGARPVPAPSGSGEAVELAPVEKVVLCHVTGNGRHHRISVDDSAEEAHRAHGDVDPGTNGLDDECHALGICALPPDVGPCDAIVPRWYPSSSM